MRYSLFHRFRDTTYVETIAGQFRVIPCPNREGCHLLPTEFRNPIFGYSAEVVNDYAVCPGPRYKLTDTKLFDHSIESPWL